MLKGILRLDVLQAVRPRERDPGARTEKGKSVVVGLELGLKECRLWNEFKYWGVFVWLPKLGREVGHWK